jgi:ferredoxin-NADP reductase
MIPSILQIRRARITKSVRRTPDLFCLTVELAEADRFLFRAGQWAYLHLLDENGTSLAKGAFSFASAPEESGTKFEFAIKIYGRLTQTFSELPVGATIGVQGPFGVFVLPKEADVPIVCIAGGIGVTPFRSFLQALDKAERNERFVLIWIARTEPDLIFREEFKRFAETHPWFQYVESITRGEGISWDGKIGRLSAEWLDELAIHWEKAHVFSCGPLAMMYEAKTLVEKKGVEGKRWAQERFE